MADEPLVSAEEVASVLSAPDGEEERASASIAAGDVANYSLRRPATIAPDDEPRAREQMEKLAIALAKVLARELGSAIEVELQGFQQQTAGSAAQGLADPVWTLGFLDARGSGGAALVLDPTAALTLVELALGGHGTAAADGRPPTALERRLLGSLAGLVIPRLNQTGGFDFSGGRFETGGIPATIAVSGEVVGVGLLKLKLGDSEKNGVLAVTPGLLRGAEDEEVVPAEPGPVAPLLEKVTVDVRPVLAAGRVSLKDLTSLSPGDVLRFEVDAGEELQLRVRGQTVFGGRVTRDDRGARFSVAWRRGVPGPDGSERPAADAQKINEPTTEARSNE